MPAALEAWRASYCLAWRWRGRGHEVSICGFVVRKGCFIFFLGRSAESPVADGEVGDDGARD